MLFPQFGQARSAQVIASLVFTVAVGTSIALPVSAKLASTQASADRLAFNTLQATSNQEAPRRGDPRRG